MITDDGKYYLYRHVRLDTNEVFYIGIGTKSKRDYKTKISTYYRAHQNKGRNIIWNNIANKTEYVVHILLESNDYDYIKEKEKEFIKLYGKINDSGRLCNLTDGGDGVLGIEKPKSSRSKYSKKVYQFDLDGKFIRKWDCGYDIERELGYYANSIYDCCNNKKSNKTAYKFQWSYKKKSMNKVSRYSRDKENPIHQYTKNLQYISTYKSIHIASSELNISANSIYNVVNKKGGNKTAHGFFWSKNKLSKNEKHLISKEIQNRKSAYFKLFDKSGTEIHCNGCDRNSWHQNSTICAKCKMCWKCCTCEKRKMVKSTELFYKKRNDNNY